MTDPPPSDFDPLDVVGTWRLARTIVEFPDETPSTVSGSTSLSLERDGRIRWSEEGTLTRQGRQTPVSRVLYIEPRGSGWFVTFDDGRDFHPWQPGTAVEHACSADLYRGTIQRLSDRRWSVRWEVSGPHKDYTMTSVLTRR